MPIFWWGMMLIMLVSVQQPDAGFRAHQRYRLPDDTLPLTDLC